jgi:uncharacterized protein (TIGR02301 family)
LIRLFRTSLVLLALSAAPALAIDPPYQRQMERLAEVMGSLYYLQPLCKAGTEDWRAQMSELITLDEPDEDRRQRLAGAFNSGYTAFSRFTSSAPPPRAKRLAGSFWKRSAWRAISILGSPNRIGKIAYLPLTFGLLLPRQRKNAVLTGLHAQHQDTFFASFR